MFISLVLWMIIPSLYFAIRMHIVAVKSVDIDILGQMEWFDLIDEIFVTTLIMPLYCLLKDQKPSVNGFAFGVSCGIYAAF
ncbi:MAG: hypothetical protein K2M91_02960, partial [Lachnospiraceae bacterium]|nr:hypothetical protein [Lachnospiraceae bacterium]